MKREIWFDMDGTIANLYGVDGWLNDLINEDVRPYAVARPLINMQVLARVLNRLIKNGWAIGIVSWTSKNGTIEYNEKVAEVKKNWLKKHLASVEFSAIKVIEYGTPKSIVMNDKNAILFDDEVNNRNEWNGIAYDVNNILEVLKGLEREVKNV